MLPLHEAAPDGHVGRVWRENELRQRVVEVRGGDHRVGRQVGGDRLPGLEYPLLLFCRHDVAASAQASALLRTALDFLRSLDDSRHRDLEHRQAGHEPSVERDSA